MPYTIPSDTHLVGDLGHTTDHNNIIDVLSGMGAVCNVKNTAWAGGAKGDGVTNDTAAIQAAINAAGTNGGVVYFPPGLYMVSQLTLASGVTLRGTSAGTFPDMDNIPGVSVLGRINSTNLDLLLAPDGTNYVHIFDLAIDGNKTHNTTGMGLKLADGASGQESQFIIERCFFHDNPDSNLYLGHNRRASKVISSTFNQSANGDGITTAGSDNRIINCITGSNGRAGVCLGTDTTQNWAASASPFGTDVAEVLGCDIFLNQVGVAIAHGATNCLVAFNGIDRNTKQGITVYDGTSNTIENNALHSNGTLTNNTYAHIDIGSGVTAVGINNNNFGPLDAGVTNVANFGVNVQAGGPVGAILGNIGVIDATSTVGGLINTGSIGDPPKLRMSNIGAIVQGAANYDVFQLRGSGGSVFTKVGQGGVLLHSGNSAQFSAANGHVFGSATALASAVLTLVGTGTGTTNLKTQLIAAQTADILDCYASNGTTLLAAITAGGAFQPGNGSAAGGHLYSGSGAPNITGSVAGDYYFRTDTPGTVNQRIYVATAGNTWTGIV